MRCGIALAGAACGLLLAMAAAAAEPGTLQATARWAVKGAFEDKDEAGSISGLRCVPVAGRLSCLMATDEKRFARRLDIEGNTLVVGRKVDLLKPSSGKPGDDTEADAEGVDVDGGAYYVTGSHGLSKKGVLQPTRYHVYRLPIDPGTGEPGAAEASDALLPILQAIPELAGFVDKPIQAGEGAKEHGVNIEGLAVRDGKAFFGLRGPVQDGTAFVVSLAVEALFGGGNADARLLKVRLGQGIGIRDMAKVAGGFLLLTGPEKEQPGHAGIAFWDGSSAEPRPLGGLDTGGSAKAKPEALLLLDEDAGGYRVLVLSDSVKNGLPAEYRVAKRPAS